MVVLSGLIGAAAPWMDRAKVPEASLLSSREMAFARIVSSKRLHQAFSLLC
ncbi:MAG: hypothetical protein ACR2QJ_02900 [Geminicoccaceae bacterium]